jgi:hypothetical protein
MISWVLWVACVGAVDDSASVVTSPPPGVAPAPKPEPLNTTIVAKWAWPSTDGGDVVGAGNLLGPTAISTVDGVPCGSDRRVDAGFVFATVSAAPTKFPEPPPNQAATLERGAWRLSDALGPREGIVPGASGPEAPSRQLGVNLRTLRKTRRPNGPPVLLVVGSRDGKVAVALLDMEAEKVLASDTFEWKGTSPLEVSPITDVDGDGRLELFLGADDPAESLRASWRIDLASARLARASLETSPAKVCPN